MLEQYEVRSFQNMSTGGCANCLLLSRVQDVYATVFVRGHAGVSTESSSEASRKQHAKMYVVFQIVFYSSVNINFLSSMT